MTAEPVQRVLLAASRVHCEDNRQATIVGAIASTMLDRRILIVPAARSLAAARLTEAAEETDLSPITDEEVWAMARAFIALYKVVAP